MEIIQKNYLRLHAKIMIFLSENGIFVDKNDIPLAPSFLKKVINLKFFYLINMF